MSISSKSHACLHWLRGFLPGKVHVNYRERTRASVGALIGILFTTVFTTLFTTLLSHYGLGSQTSLPFIIAPIASAITPIARMGFSDEDITQVIQKYNEVLDISPDDLANLFAQTEMNAYRRRFEYISCADIMSRDMISVNYETPLDHAWQLLRKHKIKSLPVVDKNHQIIGIVSLVDFMKHARLDSHQGLESKLKQFVQGLFENQPGKKRMVGEIMTAKVYTAKDDTHIIDLVPALSDAGMHHIPIVDPIGRLVGIVTQSDLIAALYRARLNDVQTSDAHAK